MAVVATVAVGGGWCGGAEEGGGTCTEVWMNLGEVPVRPPVRVGPRILGRGACTSTVRLVHTPPTGWLPEDTRGGVPAAAGISKKT